MLSVSIILWFYSACIEYLVCGFYCVSLRGYHKFAYDFRTLLLPVLYIFGKKRIDMDDLLQKFQAVFPDARDHILVVWSGMYYHCRATLLDYVEQYENLVVSEIMPERSKDSLCGSQGSGELMELKNCHIHYTHNDRSCIACRNCANGLGKNISCGYQRDECSAESFSCKCSSGSGLIADASDPIGHMQPAECLTPFRPSSFNCGLVAM